MTKNHYPEYFTIAQAIAKAVEMGGGEIYCEAASIHMTVSPDGTITNCNALLPSYVRRDYTVRPLPDEYPLDFSEAWEALGRGEIIEYSSSGKTYIVEPWTHLRNCLRDKKFRIVNR